MQFHISPTPRQRRIRRIPTIRLQTVKHIRGNCMRNCWADRDMLPRNLARNSIEQSFNKVRKRCNSNDLNSMFERVAGELRAKLLSGGGAWPGFESTRRAKLAARTARGRAAAHRHTQRPGPPAPGTPVGQQATPQIRRRSAGITRPRGGRPRA